MQLLTFDEAMAVLALDGTADADAARRAYLKLVKRYKPEVDPEAFQRVRAAWEVLEAHFRGAGELAARIAAGGATTRTVSPEAQPPPGAPSLETFRAEFAALPPDAAPHRAVEIAQRAVDLLPHESEVWLWLASALTVSGSTGRAAAALRGGAAKTPSLLLDLAHRFPEELTEGDAMAMGTAGPSAVLWETAVFLAHRGFSTRAVQVALASHQAAERAGEQHPATADDAFMLMLVLHQLGDVAAARSFQDAFHRRATSHTYRARSFADWVRPMLLELNALPDAVPVSLRMPIARALLEGGAHQQLHAVLGRFQAAHPERALVAHRVLSQCAHLWQVFAPPFTALRPPARPSRLSGKAQKLLLALFFVSAGLLVALYLHLRTPEDARQTGHPTSPPETMEVQLDWLANRGSNLCRNPQPADQTSCVALARAAEALQLKKCAEASDWNEVVVSNGSASPNAEDWLSMHAILGRAINLCSGGQ